MTGTGNKPCLHCDLLVFVREWLDKNPHYNRTEAFGDIACVNAQLLVRGSDPEELANNVAGLQKHFNECVDRARRQQMH